MDFATFFTAGWTFAAALTFFIALSAFIFSTVFFFLLILPRRQFSLFLVFGDQSLTL